MAAEFVQVDARIAGLFAGAAAALAACAAAVIDPALGRVADAALSLSGLAAAVALWVVGGRRERGLRGWRLLALAPLPPAVGTVVATLVGPNDPLQAVVARWVPTVPGYLLAIAALLTLAGGRGVRVTESRVGVEVALFLTACLVIDQMLVLGPDGHWSDLRLSAQFVLGAAVLVTSSAMAAALTLVGAVEPPRQCMALVLLAGAGALAGGRALATAARISGPAGALGVSRFLVVGGLALLVLAALLDVRAGSGDTGRWGSGRSTQIGQVLPHAAMLAATGTVAVATMLGHRPSPVSIAGVVLCVLLTTVHRAITAREDRRLGARLQRSEAYFRSLVHDGGDPVIVLDDALRITWVSPALESMLHRPAHDLVGRWLLEVVAAEDAGTVTATLGVVSGASRRLLTLRLTDGSGGTRDVEAGVSDLRRHADVGAVVLHCRDVTERLARERELERSSTVDELTGLPNRTAFVHALARAVDAVPAGTGPDSAIVVIEIEGIDRVREQAGRGAAGAVLVELARRLRGTVREEDLVGRLGDEVFAVVASGAPAEIDRLADRCLSVVEQPVAGAAGVVDVTASVGVAALEAGVPVEELFDRADLAVRSARAAGPGHAVPYVPRLRETAARRDRLRDDLRDARARRELSLLFQPVVSLDEHRVTGLEAMPRWRHGELGEVPPSEFLPIAENAGLIGELQRWVLEEATSHAAACPLGELPVYLAVDIAPGYVAGGTLVSDVAAALSRSGLAANRLILEIPEAALAAQAEQLGDDIAALRLMGVHVSVENFGTGHVPLVQLTQVPIDGVKFDRSFIARIDHDRQSRAMFESVVGIVRSLGLAVVADGVETPAQLATLRALGCDFAEGTLLSRPLPPAEVAVMLRDGAGLLWPGLVGEST